MGSVDIRTVQELMGHASITMTMKYSHLAPIHRHRAVQILDSAYRTDTETDTEDSMEVQRSGYLVEKTGRDGEIRTRDPLNPIQWTLCFNDSQAVSSNYIKRIYFNHL